MKTYDDVLQQTGDQDVTECDGILHAFPAEQNGWTCVCGKYYYEVFFGEQGE